jgi:hypothetical protein
MIMALVLVFLVVSFLYLSVRDGDIAFKADEIPEWKNPFTQDDDASKRN